MSEFKAEMVFAPNGKHAITMEAHGWLVSIISPDPDTIYRDAMGQDVLEVKSLPYLEYVASYTRRRDISAEGYFAYNPDDTVHSFVKRLMYSVLANHEGVAGVKAAMYDGTRFVAAMYAQSQDGNLIQEDVPMTETPTEGPEEQPRRHVHNYIEIATGTNPRTGKNSSYQECMNPGCTCRTKWVDE